MIQSPSLNWIIRTYPQRPLRLSGELGFEGGAERPKTYCSGSASHFIAKHYAKQVLYKNVRTQQFRIHFGFHIFFKVFPMTTWARFLRRALIAALLCSLCLGLQLTYGFQTTGSYEFNRARLLEYVLRYDLETLHFTHKKIDNDLAKSVFGLFLKQLDFQKRLLLQSDVEKLRAFSEQNDPETSFSRLKLAEEGADVLAARIRVVQQMVREILTHDVAFSSQLQT